jgi:hypothetical protein
LTANATQREQSDIDRKGLASGADRLERLQAVDPDQVGPAEESDDPSGQQRRWPEPVRVVAEHESWESLQDPDSAEKLQERAYTRADGYTAKMVDAALTYFALPDDRARRVSWGRSACGGRPANLRASRAKVAAVLVMPPYQRYQAP